MSVYGWMGRPGSYFGHSRNAILSGWIVDGNLRDREHQRHIPLQYYLDLQESPTAEPQVVALQVRYV